MRSRTTSLRLPALVLAAAVFLDGPAATRAADPMLPPPVGPVTPRVEATLAEDGLYHQSWFQLSFLNLREDFTEAKAAGKRFAVVFEQRGCPYCAKMHTEVLAQRYINDYVRELTGRVQEYDEWYYWLSIFGTPSASEPWGWQIDGHHLNVNCFVLGDQLVMTPTFMGSEPVLARFGKYSGIRVFAAEEEQGHALMRSLSTDEQARGHEFVLYAHQPIAMSLDAHRFPSRVVAGGGGTRWEQQQLLSTLARDHVDVFFAPGYTALTTTCGGVMSGNWETGKRK